MIALLAMLCLIGVALLACWLIVGVIDACISVYWDRKRDDE